MVRAARGWGSGDEDGCGGGAMCRRQYNMALWWNGAANEKRMRLRGLSVARK